MTYKIYLVFNIYSQRFRLGLLSLFFNELIQKRCEHHHYDVYGFFSLVPSHLFTTALLDNTFQFRRAKSLNLLELKQ